MGAGDSVRLAPAPVGCAMGGCLAVGLGSLLADNRKSFSEQDVHSILASGSGSFGAGAWHGVWRQVTCRNGGNPPASQDFARPWAELNSQDCDSRIRLSMSVRQVENTSAVRFGGFEPEQKSTRRRSGQRPGSTPISTSGANVIPFPVPQWYHCEIRGIRQVRSAESRAFNMSLPNLPTIEAQT
jgi:hypothetical protein